MLARPFSSLARLSGVLRGSRSAWRHYTASRAVNGLVLEKIPQLGESITEGTISSWTKAVGEAVAVDECVVIIETDKVSVDIKATVAGVLSSQLVAEGDDAAVGDGIFEIDSEGTATVSAAAPAVAVAPAPAAAAAAAPIVAAAASSGHRVPLIKFLGKRSLLKKTPAAPTAATSGAAAAAAGAAAARVVKEGNGEDFMSMPGGAWFGRPKLSEAEMEAIESGGASELW